MADHESERDSGGELALGGASADCAEGVGAFLEKRSPVFTQTVPADLPEVFQP